MKKKTIGIIIAFVAFIICLIAAPFAEKAYFNKLSDADKVNHTLRYFQYDIQYQYGIDYLIDNRLLISVPYDKIRYHAKGNLNAAVNNPRSDIIKEDAMRLLSAYLTSHITKHRSQLSEEQIREAFNQALTIDGSFVQFSSLFLSSLKKNENYIDPRKADNLAETIEIILAEILKHTLEENTEVEDAGLFMQTIVYLNFQEELYLISGNVEIAKQKSEMREAILAV